MIKSAVFTMVFLCFSQISCAEEREVYENNKESPGCLVDTVGHASALIKLIHEDLGSDVEIVIEIKLEKSTIEYVVYPSPNTGVVGGGGKIVLSCITGEKLQFEPFR